MAQPTVDTMTTDVLILGSGRAGLFAALHVYEANPQAAVLITVKGLLGKSGCTRMVQGGYNAVLHPSDSLAQHFQDTIEGGAYLNDQELAWTLIKTAPDRVRELENRLGCFFDRNADGTIHQKAFAGQSFDRTVHRGDLTGIEIMTRLMEQVFRHQIPNLQDHRGIELLHTPDGDGVAGALCVDMRRGTFLVVRGKATLLATGAGPTMYKVMAPSVDYSFEPAADWLDLTVVHKGGCLAATTGCCFRPTAFQA
jgi:fumarate reductase flavoprotein subunit